MKRKTENKRLSAGRWGVAGLSALFLFAGTAQAKKYIVQINSPQMFQTMNMEFQTATLRQTMDLQKPAITLQSFGFNKASDVKVEDSLQNLQMLVVDSNDDAAIAALKNNPAVGLVEEDHIFPAPKPMNISTTDSHQSLALAPFALPAGQLPWGIEAVKAPEAWAQGIDGKGIRVLVLDTGVDKDHPDIKGNFLAGKNFFGRRANDPAPYPYWDDVGHGTHVSGTILADGAGSGLKGVAPNAKLLMGRVCSTMGCSTVAIVQGIDWGISQKVDVISMSLGGKSTSAAEEAAYQRAEAANIVVVAAAGNDGSNSLDYPAAYPTTVGVGAVDSTLTRASFSQYGPDLDVVAPGVDVYSSVPQGSGRESHVAVDFGDGFNNVNSAAFVGSPEIPNLDGGSLAYAGLGRPQDFKGVDVKGHWALIERGEIPFIDKANNAIKNGAVGVVIYNNEDGLVQGALTQDGTTVKAPVVEIEKVVGEQIRQALSQGKTVQVQAQTLKTNYAKFSGTSMATPHVSGVVALIREANPNLTAAQVRDLLRKTATPLSPNTNNQYGSGLVNADAAVQAALGSGALMAGIN